jgi:hypothetical protein
MAKVADPVDPELFTLALGWLNEITYFMRNDFGGKVDLDEGDFEYLNELAREVLDLDHPSAS